MKEINDKDAAVISDVLKKDVEEAKKVNDFAKKRGWSGTGVIGYHILRLEEIIDKLK